MGDKFKKYLLVALLVLAPFIFLGTYKYPDTLYDGATTEMLVGGGAGSEPVWGTDIPTAVTIGSKYVYRADGTDVPIADGGTGQGTATAGFDALSPMTTIGDLIYGGAGGTGTRLGAGATTEIMVGGGAGAPVWTTATGTGAPVRAGDPAFTGFPTTPVAAPDADYEVANKKYVDDNAGGGGGGQVNLLINSGIEVWSNSEDLYTTAGDDVADDTVEDATDLITHGNFDDNWAGTDPDLPTGWTNSNADAGEISDGGGWLHLDVDAAAEGFFTDTYTFEAEKSYEFTGSFTRTAGSIMLRFLDGDASNMKEVILTATDTTYSIVLKSVVGGAGAKIRIDSEGGAAEWAIDKMQFHEVTPGITGANVLGADGHSRTSGLKVYGTHGEDTYINNGYYGLKAVKAADTAEYYNYDTRSTEPFLYGVRGQTITVGQYLYSVTAVDNLKLQINDGVTDPTIAESAFVGAGAKTWVEVTQVIAANATEFTPRILLDGDTNDVVYASPVMCVFGSSIGSGNYVQPPRELINCEASIGLTDYTNDALADATILLEAQSLGKIPKGARAVWMDITATGAGATDIVDIYESSSKVIKGATLDLDGANPGHATGRAICDSNGDIYVDETGTVTAATFKIIAIEVN